MTFRLEDVPKYRIPFTDTQTVCPYTVDDNPIE